MLDVKGKRGNANIILKWVRKIKAGKTGYAPDILKEEEWAKTPGQTALLTRIAAGEKKEKG